MDESTSIKITQVKNEKEKKMEYFHENGKQVSEKLYERIRKIRLLLI